MRKLIGIVAVLLALFSQAGCVQGGFGARCEKDADCNSGLCGQNRLCSKRCVREGDCGPGWLCPPQLSGESFCICTPQPEVVDGKDNDCDGLVDE